MTIYLTAFDDGQQPYIALAQMISSARKSVGYSIEQLAVTTGLTVDEIELIENGKDTDLARLKRLGSALQLTIPDDL